MALKKQTIQVTPADLGTASANINVQAENFKGEIDRLYSDIDAMHSKWEGEDYNEFKSEMDEYKPELLRMYQLMKDYASYLSKTKTDYESAQNEVKTKARAIVTSK